VQFDGELLFGFCFCFRFVSKQICLFRLFQNSSETPKQTEKIIFWFCETNRKWTETECVSVCFCSNRKKNLIISRTPYITHCPITNGPTTKQPRARNVPSQNIPSPNDPGHETTHHEMSQSITLLRNLHVVISKRKDTCSPNSKKYSTKRPAQVKDTVWPRKSFRPLILEKFDNKGIQNRSTSVEEKDFKNILLVSDEQESKPVLVSQTLMLKNWQV
jgi:hypothetical protein